MDQICSLLVLNINSCYVVCIVKVVLLQFTVVSDFISDSLYDFKQFEDELMKEGMGILCHFAL